MHKFIRWCKSRQEDAKVDKRVDKWTRGCTSLLDGAQMDKRVHKFIRWCTNNSRCKDRQEDNMIIQVAVYGFSV